MRSKFSYGLVFLLVAASLAATACGGGTDPDPESPSDSGAISDSGSRDDGGSDTTPTSTEPTRTPTPSPTSEPVLRYPGLAIELGEGDFWSFRWEFSDQSCAQGSGCSTSEEDGVFVVQLGESRTINGVEMFEVRLIGDPHADDGAVLLGPKWDYIGTDGTRLLGSDGFSAVTIFDASDGEWTGSGFFARFDGSEMHVASPTSISSQPFAAWPGVQSGPAVSVVRSDSESMCEVIEGRRICPRDQAFSVSETQYYQDPVGPAGYTYQFSASFSGGGFFSSSTTAETVALIGTSFRGDVLGPATGLPATPTPVPALPPRLGQPTPTPEINLDIYFGPQDGALTLININDQIPDFKTGVDLAVGVVDVTFVNPDVPGDWSYGITFRHSAEEEFHAVYVTSGGQWQHFSRGGTTESQVSTALSSVAPASMNFGVGAENRLFLVFNVDEAAFFVNNELVAELDLSTSNARVSGDVRVMAGLLSTDTYDGAESEFFDLTVLAP